MNKAIKLNILTMVSFVITFGIACWGEEFTLFAGLVNAFHAFLCTMSISLAYFIWFMTDDEFRNNIYSNMCDKNPVKMKEVEFEEFSKVYEMIIFVSKFTTLVMIMVSLMFVVK